MHSCAQCKVAHYCNRACQKRDWKGLHKHICAPNPVSDRCVQPTGNLAPPPPRFEHDGPESPDGDSLDGGGGGAAAPGTVAGLGVAALATAMATVLGAVRTAVMQVPEPIEDLEPQPEVEVFEDPAPAVPLEEKEEEPFDCPICQDNVDTAGDGQPGGQMDFGCCFKCGQLMCGVCCRQVSLIVVYQVEL